MDFCLWLYGIYYVDIGFCQKVLENLKSQKKCSKSLPWIITSCPRGPRQFEVLNGVKNVSRFFWDFTWGFHSFVWDRQILQGFCSIFFADLIMCSFHVCIFVFPVPIPRTNKIHLIKNQNWLRRPSKKPKKQTTFFLMTSISKLI